MAIDKQSLSEKGGTLYSNVSCDQIQIAEDKLRLKLISHLSKVRKSRNWTTSLGIALTSLTPLFTADFRNFGAIKGSFIELVFILITVASGLSFIYRVFWSIFCGTSVDKIIDDCKNNE